MPDNILIIKPSALGDVAITLPFLASLRTEYPNAKISWFVRSEFAPLLSMVKDVDDIVIFDRKRLGKWWCHPTVFGELVTLIKKLNKAKYDMVIDLQCLFRTGFFAWVTASKKRIGIQTSRELASYFYTSKLTFDDDCVHIIDKYLSIAKKLGCTPASPSFPIMSDDEANNTLADIQRKNDIPAGDYAVFIPTAAHQYKCWPIDRFAETASRLTSKYNLNIIASGTAADKDYIDKMVIPNAPIFNLSGRTNIPELVALLKGAKFVLSNDTGPGQIASVMGIPMIMIIGNTNPKIFGPYVGTKFTASIDPDTRGPQIKDYSETYSIENISVGMVEDKIISNFNEILR